MTGPHQGAEINFLGLAAYSAQNLQVAGPGDEVVNSDLASRILDGSPDAVLVCDRTGIVRYWNIAAERVFGFRATEAVGASMDLIIPERLRTRHLGRLGIGHECSCDPLQRG